MAKIMDIDLKDVQNLILMHEDVSSALTSLPDFGFSCEESKLKIQYARNIVNELKNMLHHVLSTGSRYEESFKDLQKVLEEAGVSQCVDDLITVRQNSRRLQEKKIIF